MAPQLAAAEEALCSGPATAAKLRERHWQLQSGLDWQPVGDFSPVR